MARRISLEAARAARAERSRQAVTLEVPMDAVDRLSDFERQAFAVAVLLDLNVEPNMWQYIGQRYGGKYRFRHKLTGEVVSC